MPAALGICETIYKAKKEEETLPKNTKKWKLFPNILFGNNVKYSPLLSNDIKTSTKSVQRCVSLCKVKKVEHNVKRNTLTFFYI